MKQLEKIYKRVDSLQWNGDCDMKKITFINSKGQSVELGNHAPYVLNTVEGIGGVKTDIQTQKSPFQDGESYINNSLEARNLSLEVTVIAKTEDEMIVNRKKLLQVFNPKQGQGTLICNVGNTTRKITAISELAPTFSQKFTNAQKTLLQLYCAVPFWTDEIESNEEIITWIGGLRFPLILPTTFSLAGSKKINIVNTGDVETPVKFEFKGPATNPRITNLTTGEYIQINRTLLPEDLLVVTTDFGNKRVEINGVNVFNWIDLGSTFWQLQPGDNIIEYTSDDATESAQVKVTYSNRYIGV